jgi:hypothetical protein
MLVAALISGLLASAAPATTPSAHDPSIIVTGRAIQDNKTALAACLARRCPPDQDIDATLALAESQLIDGEYHDARRTLLASLGRNKDEASRYPIPLSDLYRANGKVAADLGLDSDYYRSTWGIYRTLKYGLPSDDVRRFSALMEVAEMMYRTRGHERARLYYELIAGQARKAGRPDIAALAELRSAIRHLPPNSSWQLAEIRRVASLSDPGMRAPALEAKLALARMAYAKGDESQAQIIQNELAVLNIKRPILIYSPPYEMPERDTPRGSEVESAVARNIFNVPAPGEGNAGGLGVTYTKHGPAALATSRITPNVEDMWLDVAFRVTPEGRVADLRVARSKGDAFWAKPLLASIAGRRYTPGDPNSATSRRFERYTYTSGFEKKSGTHSNGHSPDTRVEYMDLSDEAGGLSVVE